MRAYEFLFEAAYDSMVAAMIKQFPEKKTDIDHWVTWCKNNLKKADRIIWFLKIVRAHLSDKLGLKELGHYRFKDLQILATGILHFYGYDYQPIENYQYRDQPVDQVIKDLTDLESRWKNLQNLERGVTPQAGDYQLFTFNDGLSWWFVDRGYCPEEGRSGVHCGNIAGKSETDQRILSLRNRKNQVLCTFILLPGGLLGEMKAKGNQKPSEKLHPHILTLLMWDQIKGIAAITGQYNPSANFNVFDLSESQLQMLDQQKPVLITSQIESSPISGLLLPDSFKKKYQNHFPTEVRSLLFSNDVNTWEKSLITMPKLIVHAPPELDNWRQRLIRTVGTSLDDEDNDEFLLVSAPSSISKNYDLVRDIIDQYPHVLAQVNPNLRGYADLCSLAVQRDGTALKWIPPEYQTEEIVKTAVRNNGVALSSVPEEKRTLELYQLAIETSGYMLEGMPDEWITADICDTAIRASVFAFKSVPIRFKTPKMCEYVCSQHGRSLEYVPAHLLTSKLIKIAIKNDSYAFKFVPNDIKTAKLCQMAVAAKADCLKFVPMARRTPELCLQAVKKDGYSLESVPDDLITAEMCAVAARTRFPLYRVPEKLRTEELCRLAVNQPHNRALGSVPDHLKTEEICLAAVSNNGEQLKDVPDHIKNKKIYLAAVKSWARAIYHVPENMRTKEMYRVLVASDGWTLQDVPEDMIDASMCRTAVADAGGALEYVPPKFMNLKLCILAVKQYPERWMPLVPEHLRADVVKYLEHHQGQA